MIKPNGLPLPHLDVAHPLLMKVETELKRMEKTRVILIGDVPTELCTATVVVPKPDDRVLICIDFTKLNESIHREQHSILSVEHILA